MRRVTPLLLFFAACACAQVHAQPAPKRRRPDGQGGGPCAALHGGDRESARDGRGARDPRARRLGRRRGGRRAARAGPRRAAVVGHRWRVHVVHDARRSRLIAYDGRETAPATATPDRFRKPDGAPMAFRDAVATGLAVGVPGAIRMLELAHRRHGRLAWSELFAPAITLADDGFRVSPRLAMLIAADRRLKSDPRAVSAYFHDADGRPLAAGDAVAQPRVRRHAAHARARRGRRVLPRPDRRRRRGDREAPSDASGRPRARRPRRLSGDRARTGVRHLPAPSRRRGMPPPSSGGTTVLAVLGILEPYDVASMGPASFWSVHFASEAGRLAFADRNAFVADPAFVDVPAGIVDPGYLRRALTADPGDRGLGGPRPAIRPASARARSRTRLPTPPSCRRRRIFPSSMAMATRSR